MSDPELRALSLLHHAEGHQRGPGYLLPGACSGPEHTEEGDVRCGARLTADVAAVPCSPLSPAAASLVALGKVSAVLFPNALCNLLKRRFT